MSGPDYPLLTLPGNEAYQLAHIATYIASAIARRRRATGRGKAAHGARWEALRDIAGGREALTRASGGAELMPSSQLPQPLDAATFRTARNLLSGGPRWAEVVSLTASGGSGWAVLGHVPGLGPVGARVATPDLAEALRQHVLTRPAAELAPWAVTEKPARLPVLPERVNLAAFVENLDPGAADARAVAAALRGADQRTDAAIQGRFAGVDLDAPPVTRPPATTPAPPVARPAAAGRTADAPESTSSLAAPAGQAPVPPTSTAQPSSPRARASAAARRAAQVAAGTRTTYQRPGGVVPAAGQGPAASAAAAPTSSAGP